jgi:hypothetical protein
MRSRFLTAPLERIRINSRPLSVEHNQKSHNSAGPFPQRLLVLSLPASKQLIFFQLRCTNNNLITIEQPSMRIEPAILLLDANSQFRLMPVS